MCVYLYICKHTYIHIDMYTDCLHIAFIYVLAQKETNTWHFEAALRLAGTGLGFRVLVNP